MKRYEPIRKYIHLTDKRNTDLSVTNLVGLTIEKRYIPSVANVIGTDLSKYKVIKQGQFACSLMQVSRDGKMPVAMYNGEPSIMSPAYPIFEVNDENELMPEYLHMYLSRPEFDREAVFRAVGGVRGSLDWEDFLDMKMPIPSIEEQPKIVAEYQAVEQRIENNNRLIKALEDTAQAIYHHTFVENIDPENLPEGWNKKGLNEIVKFKVGGDCPDVFSESETSVCNIPIYSNGEYMEGLYGYSDKATVVEDSFTISARGNVGTCFLRRHPYRGIVRLVSVIPLQRKMLYYLYFNISARNLQGDGSAQSQITVPQLSSEKIIVPKQTLIEDFYEKCDKIYNIIESIKKEEMILIKFKSLLLSKLS